MKRKTLLVSLLSLFLLYTTAHADLETGLHWLASQAQVNGALATPNDLATPMQATSEALRTLQVLGAIPTQAFCQPVPFWPKHRFTIPSISAAKSSLA